MIAMLWSFLITVAVVGSYLIGVEVGKSRAEDDAGHWEREYGDACEYVEELQARLRTYDDWIRTRFHRGEA